MRAGIIVFVVVTAACSTVEESPIARTAARAHDGADAAPGPTADPVSVANEGDGGTSGGVSNGDADGGNDEPEILVGAFASPTGSANAACTRQDPCDWKTAMKSSESTVVLMDGTPRTNRGACAPEERCARNIASPRRSRSWAPRRRAAMPTARARTKRASASASSVAP